MIADQVKPGKSYLIFLFMIINFMPFPPKHFFFKIAENEEEDLPTRCFSLLEEVKGLLEGQGKTPEIGTRVESAL